jgi:hypothetical protein
MSETNPTADYRTYKKGPNFGLIVAGAAVFLLLALVGVLMFLHRDAAKVDPHKATPTPNSWVQPLLVQPSGVRVA